jgi:hypothetical protein
MMDKKDIKQDKAMAKKAVGMHEKQLHGGKKSDLAALKKGGMAKKMADGGITSMNKVGRTIPTSPSPWSRSSNVMPKTPGKVYASGTAKKMAGGGCAKMARGGGIEVRGKTRGKMI